MSSLSEEDEATEKQKDRIVEIQSKLFDKASAYTNLILIGGYAGSFTIWSATKAQLTPRANITTALLLGASLTVFILFEVYKMTHNALHIRRVAAALATATSSKDFLDKARSIDKLSHESNLLFTRIWAVCLVASLVTALPAIFLLLYNFFAFLVGLPILPT
jgi:hypothetical protein